MRWEASTEQGDSAKPNEDWFGASNSCIVVLDGVSAPAGDLGCVHGTPWFVERLGTRLLMRCADAESPAGALAEAIEDVAALHRGTCNLDHPGTPSAAAAVLRRKDPYLEYLVVADATILANTNDGLLEVTDKRVDAVVVDERDAALRHPVDSADHQRLLQVMIDRQRELRNTPEGYWVVQNDPEAAQHAITGRLPLDGLHGAIAMTDGASRLVELFQDTSWEGLYSEVEKSGVTQLLHRVRAIEQSDPDGTTWPRYKTSDDATLVVCSFEPEADVSV